MTILPLILIPVLYFLFALTKPNIQSKVPINLCAICLSVAITWAALLVIHFAGYAIDPGIINILMGMSITGLMYKMESAFKKYSLKNFWLVRLFIVLGGLYSVITLLNGNFKLMTFILITTAILIFLFTFMFQGTTHEDVQKENKDSGKIINRLDNCC